MAKKAAATQESPQLTITEVPGSSPATADAKLAAVASTGPVPLVRQRMTLYEVTLEAKLIEEALIASDGELTPELEERFDNLLRQGPARIEAAVSIVKELIATADGAAAEVKRMQARKQSFLRNADTLKARVVIALDEAFGGKVKTGRYTVWTQAPKECTKVEFLAAPDLIEHLYIARKDLVVPTVTFAIDEEAVLAIWEAERPEREAYLAEMERRARLLAEFEAAAPEQRGAVEPPPAEELCPPVTNLPEVISVSVTRGDRFLLVR